MTRRARRLMGGGVAGGRAEPPRGFAEDVLLGAVEPGVNAATLSALSGALVAATAAALLAGHLAGVPGVGLVAVAALAAALLAGVHWLVSGDDAAPLKAD